MLDLKAQYQSLRDEIRQAIDGVLDSQMCVLGPAVRGFEEQIDEMIPPARTLGVSNGTDALLIALMALEVGPGDEVILPPFTFFATAAAVLRVGAKPVFVDIEEQTFNIDPDVVSQAPLRAMLYPLVEHSWILKPICLITIAGIVAVALRLHPLISGAVTIACPG